MIRIGIAGIGFMGMVHYLTYLKVRGAKVAAICEQDKKRLAGDWRDIKGNFGPAGTEMDLADVATYSDLDEMIADPQLDAIDVTLPPALHAEVAVKALQAGKHVFCEKPMALAMDDCQQMVAAAKQCDRQLMIGHVLPFFPEYAWALELIRGGQFGKLLGGNFRRVISDPDWLPLYWKADSIGGPMLDLHVHDAHFIRLLFGMPKSVSTTGRMRGELAENWTTLFNFNGDVAVTATSGTIGQQGRPFDHGFEIHLEKATLLFQFAVLGGEGKYLCEPTILNDQGEAIPANLAGGDPMDAFEAELNQVVKALESGQVADPLGCDLACDAVVICQAQTASLQKGETVSL